MLKVGMVPSELYIRHILTGDIDLLYLTVLIGCHTNVALEINVRGHSVVIYSNKYRYHLLVILSFFYWYHCLIA